MSQMPDIRVEYITTDGKPHQPADACASARVEAPEVEVVSVNGVEISSATIQEEAQHHPAADANTAILQATRALVVRELLLQEADRKSIDTTPEVNEAGQQELLEDSLIQRLLEQEVTVPQADEATCKYYYKQHLPQFMSETLYEARHILLPIQSQDPQAAEQVAILAQGMIEQIKQQPQLFAQFAMTHSACPSKEQGGNLGQLSKGSTVSEFEAALHQAKEGELLEQAVRSRFGYHIIYLDRIIHGEQLPFIAVKDKIAAYLEASSWSRGVAQYIGILAGQANIQGIDIASESSPLVQ